MNDAKVCVSVSAATAGEFLERVEQAGKIADIIEIRADHLPENERAAAFSQVRSAKPLLLTFRPRNEGGNAADNIETRTAFWNSELPELSAENKIIIDNELSLLPHFRPEDGVTIIRSFHDFKGAPGSLEKIYESIPLEETAKIAVMVNDAADAIPLWKLLERSVSEGRKMIAIAMGEAGKWTRILGPANGSRLTYAPLSSDGETAPGQIAAEKLVELYRVRELRRDTDVYGIIAGDTSYSVSPIIHNSAFREAGDNAVFVPLKIEDIEAFFRRMVRPETREIELNFKGFAVTNPHKRNVIRFLDEIDETAAAIGAVNTIKIADGKLFGTNTDAAGFIEPLRKHFGELNGASIAIIGAGGAARACVHSLKQASADVTVFARSPEKAAFGHDVAVQKFTAGQTKLGAFDIIVNATPAGTKGPAENETVALAEQIHGVKLAYDLTYVPARTRFLAEAETAGARTLGGLEMLIGQGVRQWELWTGRTAPADVMRAAVREHLRI